MAELWLGFDWGLGWIGVASGQTETYTASKLKPIRARDGIPDWTDIEKLVDEWRPTGFVVGIPYNMDGSDSSMVVRARKFRKRLHGRFGLPAEEADERLTTREAWQHMTPASSLKKAKAADLDSIAAQIILQSWLEQRRQEQS